MKDPSNRFFLSDKKRLMIMTFFVFLAFTFLIYQFFKLQVIEGDKWEKKAKQQHQFVIKEPFKRGVFYTTARGAIDDQDPTLACTVDVPKFHLYVDPIGIPQDKRDLVATKLSTLLKVKVEKRPKLREQFDKKSRSRKLVMWISKESKQSVEKWWYRFAKKEKIPRNAIYFVGDFKRSYPCGKMLGQVLHTIREDKNVTTNQAIPTGGLELYFNQFLKGKEGRRRLLRSPKYEMDRGDLIKHPENGADIYLTIDHFLQGIAEEEIEKAVKLANAKTGWVVIMDPNTGEILALAQYPFFYPERYRSYYTDQELIEQTKVKAITDCFEPGSVFKPISLAIALKANEIVTDRGEKKLFDPMEKVNLRNVKFPGRKNPIRDVARSQFVNMHLALQKSSNVYLADLIQKTVDRLGISWYKNELSEVFGFGNKTGIELPSEARGFLPTPGKLYPNGRLQWSVPTPGCLAIGYNLLANSIHMLKAFSILANGGYSVKPTLIDKIVKTQPDGSKKVLYTREHNAEKKRVLSKKIVDQVIYAMKYVTKPGGSAFRADVPGYTEAGKTSTSEKIVGGTYAKKVHFASFVGFAPAKDAKIAVVVGIDDPEYRFLPGIGRTHYGGKCAAPVFREVAKRSLKYLGVEPDDPYGYPLGDPRYDPSKADMVEDVKQLKDLFKRWHNS